METGFPFRTSVLVGVRRCPSPCGRREGWLCQRSEYLRFAQRSSDKHRNAPQFRRIRSR